MTAAANLGSIAPVAELDEGGKSRRRRATGWIVAIVGALNLALVLRQHQPVSDLGLLYASATLWVCAFPMWRFYMARRRTIPYTALVGVAYAVYFVAPVSGDKPFFRASGLRDVGFEAVESALALTLVGVTMFVVGAFGSVGLVKRLPRLRREIDLPRAFPLLAIAALVSAAVRVVLFTRHLGVFDQFTVVCDRAGEVAMCLLVIGWLRGILPWQYKACLLLAAFCLAGVGLTTGSIANAAYPIISLVFIYSWYQRRIPWALIFAGALALAPFQVTKMQFRASHWSAQGEMSSSNVGTLLTDFVTTTFDRVSTGDVSVDEIEEGNSSRNNVLALFAIVVNDTPRFIPYWNGDTYSDLPWHFIPRFLVPSKPARSFGQEFGHRYEIIGYENTTTTVNLSQLVECYGNFGPLGVAAGMLLIGFLCASIEYSLTATMTAAAIAAPILTQLLLIESNFVLAYGGIPYTLLAMYALTWLLPTVETEPR